MPTNGAEADGKAVWSWHPLLVSSWRRFCEPNRVFANRSFADDGGKTNSSPGRARNKPLKPLRAGMPGDSGGPVATTRVCLPYHLHARLRVHWAPGIPHALVFPGRTFLAQLGPIAPRECGVMFEI